MPKIGLVWAQTEKGVIGINNTIPWHSSEDLKHFNEVTRGSTVIMGKATWFSLPERFRPLPNRRNLVLSSDLSLQADGAEVFSSLENAFASVETEWAWVMGGQRVYADALLFADRLEITKIDLPEVVGDTFAPSIPTSFRLEKSYPEQSEKWAEAVINSDDPRYRFESYVR